MTDQCGSSPTIEEEEAAHERARDDRIETFYQGWGARDMAERIVDLEDELGAEVDGICTGMHADVAEAYCEVERLRGALLELDHRLSWHTTCATCARILDSAYEETMRAEMAEAGRDRYRLAWLSARRRAADEANFGMEALELKDAEIQRLKADKESLQRSVRRLITGNRRIDDEATDWAERYADAVQECASLRARPADPRESTDAGRLECVGTVDGEAIYQLRN